MILRAFTEAAGPMKLSELSNRVGIAASQLHPYMVSFRNTGLVEQVEGTQYALGPFALELGLARLRNQDAYMETIRRVPDLAEETGLMVAVAVWGQHGTTIVYVHDSPRRIHSYVKPGNIFELGITATGRLFAAFLPTEATEDRITAEFAAHNNHDVHSFGITEEWFRARVREIREMGYEITADIPIPGVSAVAAPVFDHTGALQLSVTVIGPSRLTDLNRDGPVVAALLEFTRNLSSDLGYGGATSAIFPEKAV